MIKLSSSSNLSAVGQWRHIQAIHEPRAFRNPDYLVGRLFPLRDRWRFRFLSVAELDQLRSIPFYYYLLARTRYYDEVFNAAIASGVQFIVNVGCGSDTRSHRFGQALERNGITVLECDLPEAIATKRQLAPRLGSTSHVRYLALDLNDNAWPEIEPWLEKIRGQKAMVMMEGVSPYVDRGSFGRFLDLLAGKLQPGALLAYDFKILGVADDFARTERVSDPFRLADSTDQVAAFHQEHGFRLNRLEQGWELEARLLLDLRAAHENPHREDALLQVLVAQP